MTLSSVIIQPKLHLINTQGTSKNNGSQQYSAVNMYGPQRMNPLIFGDL